MSSLRNHDVSQSINLAFVKRHLNQDLRGTSYEQACTKSQVLKADLNCSRLMFLSLRWDGNMFQVWGATTRKLSGL